MSKDEIGYKPLTVVVPYLLKKHGPQRLYELWKLLDGMRQDVVTESQLWQRLQFMCKQRIIRRLETNKLYYSL